MTPLFYNLFIPYSHFIISLSADMLFVNGLENFIK